MSRVIESTFPSTDAWVRARDRYTADLNEDEKELYYKASLEEILYDVSAVEKLHGTRSSSRSFVQKLQPLVQAIEQYGEALDVYSNTYPLVLSSLWGSIRIALFLARETGKYFEKLVDMLTQIGDVLPRFRVFERLFANHERLSHALSNVYVDIIAFCSDAKAVFKSKRAFVTTAKVALKIAWKPFERQFEDRMASFRAHTKNVEKEAGLSHMIEASDARFEMREHYLQLEKSEHENRRKRLMASLSSVNYERKHNKLRTACLRDTGKWIFTQSTYKRWIDATDSCGLCCHGIPGSGKSIIASSVVDHLQNPAISSPMGLFYYYCDYADPHSLLSHQILGSLLKQLFLATNPSPAAENAITEIIEDPESQSQNDHIADFLIDALCDTNNVYMILDGLDECEMETQQIMIRFFRRLLACTNYPLKIFVTCRNEDRVRGLLHDFVSLELSASLVADDISLFVTFSINAKLDSGELRKCKPALQHEILAELTAKAGGMFLWVYFQVRDLCDATSDAEIRGILLDLPQGLEETYKRILIKIVKSRAQMESARKVMKWVACSKRPLHVGELREGVAFSALDKHWDADKIPDEDTLLSSCRGLVTRDDVEDTVRFAHHTVQQYLVLDEQATIKQSIRLAHDTVQQQRVLSTIDISDEIFLARVLDRLHLSRGAEIDNRLTQLFFTLRQAEVTAAETCVAYLSFSDFETALTNLGPSKKLAAQGILSSTGPSAIPGAVGIRKSWFNVPYQFFGGHTAIKPSTIDFSKYLTKRVNRPPPELSEKYALLDYVVEYWHCHTKWFDNKPVFANSTLRHQLQHLVLKKQLNFEFRPWGPNEHFGPYGCADCPIPCEDEKGPKDLPYIRLLRWAAEVGDTVMIYLLDNGDIRTTLISHCYHERQDFQTFLIACRFGRTEIVKYLLRTVMIQPVAKQHNPGHGNPDTFLLGSTVAVTWGWNFWLQAMNAACDHGHASTLQVLLNYLKELDPSTELAYQKQFAISNNMTTAQNTLHSAARHGYVDCLTLLLEYGLGTENSLAEGRPRAIHYAAENGHVDAVSVLLRGGASCDARDNQKETPLIKAAKNGHADVVQTLLDAGASGVARGGTHLDFPMDISKFTLTYPLMKEGPTAVHWAAARGHFKVLALPALASFMDQDYNSVHGASTPLHIAVMFGHHEAVEMILRSKIGSNTGRFVIENESTITYKGGRPIHYATIGGHLKVVELLLDHEADIEATYYKSKTALHLASLHNFPEIARLLFEKGANFNAIDYRLHTPLHEAAAGNNLQILDLLLDRGADIEATNERTQTALHLASLHNFAEIARLLLEKGANVNARDEYYHTPLHEAAAKNNVQVLDILLDYDVDLGARAQPNYEERQQYPKRETYTALDLAVLKGHDEVVSRLLQIQQGRFNSQLTINKFIHHENPVIRAIKAIELGHFNILDVLLGEFSSSFPPYEQLFTAMINSTDRRAEVCQVIVDSASGNDPPGYRNGLYFALSTAKKQKLTEVVAILEPEVQRLKYLPGSSSI